MVAGASKASGVPVPVVAAQIDLESAWDPSVTSPAGAEGIAQFEPGTWAEWGKGSPFVPRDAFRAYGRFMGHLLGAEQGNLRNALAAYNAGEGNVQAGYGYADEILKAAATPRVPYRNPLRDVRGLTAGRIDMGVDYGGTGPIYALGPGVITNVYNSGWPGGAFISERLTEGPLAGHYVYAAEDIAPEPGLAVGQQVTSGTQIGTLTGGPSGIETGFAEPPGTGFALGRSQFTGSNTTAYGKAYSDLLKGLGAPPGVVQKGGVTGDVPSWLHWLTNPFSGGGPGGGGGILGIPGDIIHFFADAEHAIAWFFVPSHWVRIFSGIGGTVFVAWGLWAMSRTGGPYSASVPVVGQVPVPEGGQIAPALGIASITVGAVLLFIAFHNLPSDVTDFGSFVSHLQAQIKAQPGGSSLGPP